ncbi:MAG: ABC transporter permease [Bacteroidetes bacterium]|nr:ABC transporter permease [Bacteroidota bacterium]
MEFREALLTALDSIRANKLRSVLTILGIVIGVFSVISVMTAVRTLEQSINSGLSVLGTNSFVIQKYPAIQMGHATRWQYRNRRDITLQQGQLVKQRNQLAQYVSITEDQGGEMVRSRFETTRPVITITGGDEATLPALGKYLADGRNFSEEEILADRPVALIGDELAAKLFPQVDPVGQPVWLRGKQFIIIGRLERQGNSFGMSQDNFLMIPIGLFAQLFNEDDFSIAITAPSAETFEDVVEHITGILRTIRKVPPGEDNDFEIFSNESLITTFREFTLVFSLAAAGISFIALLAAGIGIMNIMLVSVTERTREIGIRKSVGALRSDILRQFLYEAVILSQIGGILGIILGVAGGNLVSVLLDIAPVFPWDWALIGLTVCTLIGLVFGIYPAMKAANLDPIEALRYE